MGDVVDGVVEDGAVVVVVVVVVDLEPLPGCVRPVVVVVLEVVVDPCPLAGAGANGRGWPAAPAVDPMG